MRSLKIILILFWTFNFLTYSFAGTPGSYASAKMELLKVTKKELVDWINELIGVSHPSRMVGAAGHDKAKDYIHSTISRLDSKKSGKVIISSTPPDIELIKSFYQNDFDQKVQGKIPAHHPDYLKWVKFTEFMKNFAEKKKSFPVQNISWEKQGLNSDKVLIISAHYDTISHHKESLQINENESMPGANYNASGVAVALGIIKILSQMDLNYSVKVVFLDWQGIGFHGSQLFARELKMSGKTVMGVINLEMLGQDTTFFDKTKKTGNMSAYLRNQPEELAWVKGLVSHGSNLNKKVNFEIRPTGFENSDNIRFWEHGFKSVTFSQNWEDDFNPKFFQTPDDTPETLNHETLWNSYQFIAGSVVGTLLDLTR
jgi:hypothetical protein